MRKTRVRALIALLFFGLASQLSYAGEMDDEALLKGLQQMKLNAESGAEQNKWEVVCLQYIDDNFAFDTYFSVGGPSDQSEAAKTLLKEIRQAAKEKRPLGTKEAKIMALVTECQQMHKEYLQSAQGSKLVTRADFDALEDRVKFLEASVQLLLHKNKNP